ncbi:MAG TPA: DUF1761 domain-containing protein [bacterium]
MDIQINYGAVFVAAVAYFLLGWAWHSSLLFMKPWAKEMGLDKLNKKEKEKRMKEMPKGMIGNFLAVLVTAYVLAHSVSSARQMNFSGLTAGLTIGFWVWLGYIATTLLNTVLWEGRSWKLYFINVGYHLVGMLAMGSILAVWP